MRSEITCQIDGLTKEMLCHVNLGAAFHSWRFVEWGMEVKDGLREALPAVPGQAEIRRIGKEETSAGVIRIGVPSLADFGNAGQKRKRSRPDVKLAGECPKHAFFQQDYLVAMHVGAVEHNFEE